METSDSSDTDKLGHLLQTKLPQELYDRIYNLTFTAEPGVRMVRTGNSLKPSKVISGLPHGSNLRQVDKTSRWLLADSFYGGDRVVFIASNPSAMCDFLTGLDVERRKMLKDVRVFRTPDSCLHHIDWVFWARRTLASRVEPEVFDKIQIGTQKEIMADIGGVGSRKPYKK